MVKRACVLALLSAFLALPLTGCAFFKAVGAWAEAQNIDVCMEYKGNHVCVGRKDGAWTFSADLSPEEQREIIIRLGGE